MLANKIILNSLLKRNIPGTVCQVANHGSGSFFDERYAIGKREWVGFGVNGQPNYQDRSDFPMPAVRFREITGDLVALREKEKQDWKKLTIEEKKKLYRASFCQTLVEAEAPTGLWKSVVGLSLCVLSVALGSFIFIKHFIYRPLPPSFSDEHRAAALRKKIDQKYEPITGISSKWDYEKDDWKK